MFASLHVSHVMTVIKIIGGHGRVGLKIAEELTQHEGNIVISLFRNVGDWDEVAATGAIPELLDLQQAKVHELRSKLRGADIVIWCAGNGGRGGPEGTYEIDRNAAVMAMQASRQIGGVQRFIMISYLGSRNAPGLSTEHPLFHYGQAKHQADEYLKNRSGLKYTIVNPGQLNNLKATKKVDVKIDHRKIRGRSISRENVALIVSEIVLDKEVMGVTLNKEIECLDGEVDVREALMSTI